MDRAQVQIPAEQLARQRDFETKIRDMHAQRPLRAMVDTFGCQQNVADSQHIMGMLEAMGCTFTDDPAQADVVVLNTCAIRDHAEKRVYGNLGALTHTKKANPAQVICLCGCMAQRPEVAEKVRQSYRHVDLVFGPQALWKFPELLYQVYTQRQRVFSVADEHGSIAEGLPVVREGRTRAWVSIMYGCNNFCSYCIVPYVRGRERSRDPEKIIDEVRGLVAEGFKEITLLGQNVNSYGKDLPEPITFAQLLRQVEAIPGDFVIRFLSSHPKDATPELLDTILDSRKIGRHLHLPVQCGSDRILKAMNRRYTVEKYLETVDYLRQRDPDFSLTTDLIVGFPNESEEDFQGTLDLVQRVQYDNLYTFIYSKRRGTKAAEIEDKTPDAEKRQRMERLLKLQREVATAHYQRFLGRTLRVLVEGESKRKGFLMGKDLAFIIVEFPGDPSLIGQFVSVRVTQTRNWAVEGVLVTPEEEQQ